MFSQRLQDLDRTVASAIYSTAAGSLTETDALSTAIEMLASTKERGGIVYVIGNGGSSGIASHFHADLCKALKVPSQTFYDPNLMTCLANDYGYEHVFSHPLGLMASEKDMLVAISSSGQSPNIVEAAKIARAKGTTVFTLSGFASNNPLRALGHLNCYLPATEYGLVEMGHFFVLHTIIDFYSVINGTKNQILRGDRSAPLASS